MEQSQPWNSSSLVHHPCKAWDSGTHGTHLILCVRMGPCIAGGTELEGAKTWLAPHHDTELLLCSTHMSDQLGVTGALTTPRCVRKRLSSLMGQVA